ncbi:MAG: 7-cyano-7-deazaguanine synthase QueC [Candidatus Omnitrophica bacterium]|nr:7-cyano-7-deazaguanine synthase QueC [Candidatus Omnitrophota bacterium]
MGKNKPKAVVLLSGGMDSAVTLYIAKKRYDCHALIFDYGQRSRKEVGSAKAVSRMSGSGHIVLRISLPWKGSSLLDRNVAIPREADMAKGMIPSTYVPARNLIFLSYGVSYAEALGARAVFIGAHQLDYSNYPDCRGEFFDSFRETVERGTKRGVSGKSIRIITPIINYTKKDIILSGISMGVSFALTWSCYVGGARPCGECESCRLRAKGFKEAGVIDPLLRDR